MQDICCWAAIIPWIDDPSTFASCALACRVSATAASDPLAVAAWLVHMHPEDPQGCLLRACRLGSESVTSVLMREHGIYVRSTIIYDLSTSPDPNDSRALSTLLRVTARYYPPEDMRYIMSASFVLGCLHGRNDVVRMVVQLMKEYFSDNNGIRVIQGLEAQDWKDVVELLAADCVSVIDIGTAMARKGRHRSTERLLKTLLLLRDTQT
jgi:hypothetical protein